MPGPHRTPPPARRQIGIRPDPRLKPDIHLADVMQRGEHRQPRRRSLIQRSPPAGPRHPQPNARLPQQRLHTSPHIRQMMLQQMHPCRPPLPVRMRLRPEPPRVIRPPETAAIRNRSRSHSPPP